MLRRRFVVVGHAAPTDGDFSLNDLPGSGGRVDLLARAVTAAFLISHGMRRDTVVYLVHLGAPDPPKAVRFEGEKLRYLNPDERSTAALAKHALMKRLPAKGWVDSTPGVSAARMGLDGVLDEAGGAAVYLKEGGTPLREATLPGEGAVTFILSDHMNLTEEEEKAVLARAPLVVGLGPLSLHTEHCITLVHNGLDLWGR